MCFYSSAGSDVLCSRLKVTIKVIHEHVITDVTLAVTSARCSLVVTAACVCLERCLSAR